MSTLVTLTKITLSAKFSLPERRNKNIKYFTSLSGGLNSQLVAFTITCLYNTSLQKNENPTIYLILNKNACKIKKNKINITLSEHLKR